MNVRDVVGGVPIHSWIPWDELDQGTIQQITSCALHPHAFHHVCLMPDAHKGYGMPIGGVVALDGAISPAMVGVDIGCGMSCIRTTLTVDNPFWQRNRNEFADEVMRFLSAVVPVGQGKYHFAYIFIHI